MQDTKAIPHPVTHYYRCANPSCSEYNLTVPDHRGPFYYLAQPSHGKLCGVCKTPMRHFFLFIDHKLIASAAEILVTPQDPEELDPS